MSEIVKDGTEAPELVKTYFTFGFGHPLRNCFVVIEAPTNWDARLVMFELFGNLWAFDYSEYHWTHSREGVRYPEGDQAAHYGLRELPLPVDQIREGLPQ